VESNYEKKLETLEQFLDSNLVYDELPILNYVLETFSCSECAYYIERKRLKVECGDVRKCVERLITKRDISTFLSLNYATYVPWEMGTVDVGKIICSLDQVAVSATLTGSF